MGITHIGGPTVLFETAGRRILTDPTFDPPGRRYSFGFGTASRKVTGPAVPASGVGPIDVVLLSHDHHADNLDDAGRALLPSAGTVITTTSGARRLGGAGQSGGAGRSGPADVRGLAPWESTVLSSPGKPDLTITATPCRHGPLLSHPIVGDVVGFVLSWEGGPGPLWMTGDTVLYDAVRQVPDRIDVDTMLLHLGSVQFGLTGPVRYTMNAREGLELIGLAKPRLVVPVHYEGWSHFHQPESEARTLLHDPQVHWLEPGVSTEV
ncbi:MBL fold metallo-hydrolase [Cryptosporangium sp. NPDC051539]|uniref:MBL fold metallo-hydrolase n=1 Tax=Cryptosporangium sp. NPDC051539 TaxID=3363962 RepID=UPI0037A4CEA4